MKPLNALANIKIDENEGYALFLVNPKIYPLDIIYAASYVLMDKAYIFLDGDPAKEIKVEIRKKENSTDNVKQLLFAFNNELINYAVYRSQAEKNKGIREIILQRLLLTNDPHYIAEKVEPKQEEFDDPEEILRLWEESENKVFKRTKKKKNVDNKK